MGNLFSCVLICGATAKVKVASTEEADFRMRDVFVATKHEEHTQATSQQEFVEIQSTETNILSAREAQVLPSETSEQEEHEIYFLIPVEISSKSREKPGRLAVSLQPYRFWSIDVDRTKKPYQIHNSLLPTPPVMIEKHEGVMKLVVSKKYLEKILIEKKQRRRESKVSNNRSEEQKASQHHRSRSRFNRLGAWKPALESISENITQTR